MVYCFDDVNHMTNEGSARIHWGRIAVLREPIRAKLQSQLQGNPPQLLVEPTYESLPLASSHEMKIVCLSSSFGHTHLAATSAGPCSTNTASGARDLSLFCSPSNSNRPDRSRSLPVSAHKPCFLTGQWRIGNLVGSQIVPLFLPEHKLPVEGCFCDSAGPENRGENVVTASKSLPTANFIHHVHFLLQHLFQPSASMKWPVK
ncbi:unnamed protein product [Protopolystoma xenopodis]|uniref:Uncharacterized protein n=1 Tax=Protopolystoma xenopodis TaxID=117903 RepID=A0A448WTT2_9PLAT|nr:unnamed protein product [Protopolystoma xenopodis]